MAPVLVLVESNTTGTGRDFALAARSLGLRPVLLTKGERHYPYVAELDLDVVRADTADPAAVVAACAALPGVRGVTSSSEYFIETAARAARELGLPGPDPDAIAVCRDKMAARKRLRHLGPDFAGCVTPDEAAAAAARLGAVVVKPARGSGSIGVRACASSDEAREWTQRLLADGATEVVVEQEIVGPEFSVEVLAGEVVCVTAKHLGPAPFFVEYGHDVPAAAPDAIAEAAKTALAACGLGDGTAHVELRWAHGRPWLIEINPRLAGGLIPRLVRHALGRDLVTEVVAAAAGMPVDRRPGTHTHASIRFLVPGAGTVTEVSGVDEARVMPGVLEAVCTAAVGQDLETTGSFTDRRGYVVALGPTAATAAARADAAHARIRIAVAPAAVPASR
ncbi:ATP-grasp domain-containing protein [Labedaea rhizosphaerae]|uniref:Biotin carboxylase n=1 Tax=Labedaea rhizosphaerae TaxID=598644 RepID=A0A4R6RSP7_LABRH|nr:ATP-grasp domain-containing protein [Labedaea rhizosphaerae]TDP89881.1 biotin carboxylase [Labedaea rhizosphaerae]